MASDGDSRHRLRATFAIPCRNAGRYLEPLLASLLAQTRDDFELLLVDDASTDGSAARARAIAGDRIRVVENPEPRGLARNWNRCAELVRTELFCLAHQDDVYAPEYLEVMTERLRAEPRAALAHCRARTIDATGAAVAAPAESFKEGFWRRLEGADAAKVFGLLFRGNFINCPSALYRTAAWRQIGGVDPELRFAPDWRLWFELLLAGFGLAAEPRALVAYRRHDTSATRASARDLSRYREERDVLDAAAARGVAAGLLDPAAAAHRVALRNNLLYDAYRDLRDGDRDGARAKLEFARAEPRLAADPAVRLFGRLVAAGPVGTGLLGLGLRAALLRSRLLK